MANPKKPKNQQLRYGDFIAELQSAKDFYSRIVERAPYLTFIEDAYQRHEDDDMYIRSDYDLKHQAFREFLKKAGVLTASNWEKNKEFIIPAATRIVEFNQLAEVILDELQYVSGDAVDYEQIKRAVVNGHVLQRAADWYEQLRQIFNYFNEYKDYLEDAVISTEIANIASEAKKNLETTKTLASSQEKMLEKSGALARANVYYELAYGAPATTIDGVAVKRRMGHREIAMWWLVGVLASIVLTFATAVTLFVVMGIDFSRPPGEVIILLVVKALILLPFFYLIRFAVHSYRVNKHLEVVYAHRWALHKTLNSYIEVGEVNGKESALRMGQMNQITPFFYSEIETGFISKKDGLGDKSIEVIPEELMKVLKKDG